MNDTVILVKTVWPNTSGDNHDTLDYSKYVQPHFKQIIKNEYSLLDLAKMNIKK